MESSEPEIVPHGTILARMSDRLDALADDIHQIEQTIGGDIDGTQAKSFQVIRRLQRLDLVRQSLEDLALLSLTLSRDPGADLDCGTISKLRLDVTRTLLRPDTATRSSAVTVGDVDLF